ncbi:hypothetical protein BC936DRAFT_148762, partial [Jimgerdemannia flammicorona]
MFHTMSHAPIPTPLPRKKTSMKSQLENCEHDKDMLKAKLTTSEENLKIETSRHNEVRKELQKTKQILKYIETQHAMISENDHAMQYADYPHTYTYLSDQEKKMCLEISQAHEEGEHELRAEIQCLKQDAREKDEEINRQKVKNEDLIAQQKVKNEDLIAQLGEYGCLKQDVREKDEEINRQKVEIEDLIAQLEERKFVSEEQDKVIDHFLSGNFFQGASEEVKLNIVANTTNHGRPAVRKVWSKKEQGDVIMEDTTPISLHLSTQQTPNTAGTTSRHSRYLKPALRAAVTSRNRKREVTIADNDMLQSSSAEYVVRAVEHPRLGLTDENNIERRELITRRAKALAQIRVTRRRSVTSASMKENLSNGPSSTAEQRSVRVKMQQLQMANAKVRATGVVSPSPSATSSRSLAAIASKAAASAVNSPRRPPTRVAKLVSLAAHSHNTNTVILYTSSNSSEEDASSESANF